MDTTKEINIVETTRGQFDITGISWIDRQFSHPERTIRIATSFSGISAPDMALKRLGLKTKIVFASDIGERYLNYNFKQLRRFSMELDEKYASVILRRYVEDTGNADGVYVVRDGKPIAYSELVKEVEFPDD